MATVVAAGEGPWSQYRPAQRWGMLALLFLVSLSAYTDRQLLSVLIEPIKREFGVSDTAMGLLGGFAFAIFYATLGLPVARLADRGRRKLVIVASLVTWSVMTVACGFAASFPLLFLARIGVGAGEAGALPPAQSLIADYFPPEQRARALSLFLLSATVGYLAAFSGGTLIAAAHGWRTAFLVFAVPGLAIAVLAGVFLREPSRSAARSAAPQEAFGTALTVLARKPTYVLLCVAMVLYWMVAYGALVFLPSYMIRVLGFAMTKVGVVYGPLTALGALVGSVFGGWVTDLANRRGPANAARVAAMMLAAATPCYWAALSSDNLWLFYGACFVGGLALSASVPSLFTVLHIVCGSPRRSVAVAVALLFANLFGLGLGPLLTGAISDALTARMGTVGLRYALIGNITILLPAGLVLLRAARTLVRDAEP